MAKTVTFNYQGKDYTLEYNRDAIIKMEEQCFKANEKAEDAQFTTVWLLFKGAFWKNHRDVSNDTVETILKAISDKQKLYERLLEMIKEAYETISKDSESGNVNWVANW